MLFINPGPANRRSNAIISRPRFKKKKAEPAELAFNNNCIIPTELNENVVPNAKTHFGFFPANRINSDDDIDVL